MAKSKKAQTPTASPEDNLLTLLSEIEASVPTFTGPDGMPKSAETAFKKFPSLVFGTLAKWPTKAAGRDQFIGELLPLVEDVASKLADPRTNAETLNATRNRVAAGWARVMGSSGGAPNPPQILTAVEDLGDSFAVRVAKAIRKNSTARKALFAGDGLTVALQAADSGVPLGSALAEVAAPHFPAGSWVGQEAAVSSFIHGTDWNGLRSDPEAGKKALADAVEKLKAAGVGDRQVKRRIGELAADFGASADEITSATKKAGSVGALRRFFGGRAGKVTAAGALATLGLWALDSYVKAQEGEEPSSLVGGAMNRAGKIAGGVSRALVGWPRTDEEASLAQARELRAAVAARDALNNDTVSALLDPMVGPQLLGAVQTAQLGQKSARERGALSGLLAGQAFQTSLGGGFASTEIPLTELVMKRLAEQAQTDEPAPVDFQQALR